MFVFPTVSRRAVVIVTGGSTPAGRDIARELAGWAWAIVVAYLDHQRRVEATVAEIISAGGTTVAVRVNLADDLDVQRLYAESIAAFGGVDVVVHTTTEPTSLLYQHAARQVREQGAIVSVAAAERIAPEVARQLHEHGITVGRAPSEALLSILARWRQGIG